MQLNNNLIRTFNPCYDPVRYFKDQDNYSMIDLLKDKRIPAKDRLWVCVRNELMSDLQLKYYGLECAKLSLKYTKDNRVKKCLNVVSKYLKGKANIDELRAAREAAWSARLAATESAAARAAAWSAREAASAASAELAWSVEWATLAAVGLASAAAESAKAAMDEKQCKVLIKILKTIK